MYWVGDPSSYVWLHASRPESTASCPSFDHWRYGLANYSNAYERDFVLAGAAGVLARFQSRNFVFAHGLDDDGEDASTCGPRTTGCVVY